MILIKNGVKRKLTDEETIKIFLADGWKEYREEKKQPKNSKKDSK